MINWFTVKLKYTKQLDNGTLKRVDRILLLPLHLQMQRREFMKKWAMPRGEFMVSGIARTDIHNIFPIDGSNLWFKCKVSYESA